MSKLREPDPVKLFVSIIYNDRHPAESCLLKLMDRFGPADYSSRELPFDLTDYYRPEMGGPLRRRFFTFVNLVDPGELCNIKLFTSELEKEFAKAGSRTVNLDPGLISMTNFVLATGKAAPHRPYLGRGVYADLALVFEAGTFKALAWTYPDYQAPEAIAFLNRARGAYKIELRER